MKTILTSLFSFFVLCTSQAANFNFGFEGSVLCNDIRATIKVPDSLQTGYEYTTRVLLNDEKKSVLITHYFTEIQTKPVSIPLESITTDLNEAFSKIEIFNETTEEWSFSQNIQLNNITLPISIGSGNPFNRCYQYTYDCESITIYVKELRPICPEEKIEFTTRQTISNDSIFFTPHFKSTPLQVTCKALGNTVVTDSVKIATHSWKLNGSEAFNLKSQKYALFMSDSVDVVCVTTPCPSPLVTIKKIGNIDYSQCPEPLPIFNSGSFTGSALCNNLMLVYNIPESLQGNYTYDYTVEHNKFNDSLYINFFISNDQSAGLLKKIEVPMSDYFSENSYILPQVVTIIQSLYNNEALIKKDTTHGNPYSTCYEVESKCMEVTVLRKSPRKVCSPTRIYTKQYFEIKEDVLLVAFIDSIIDLGFTCFAEGFSIHTDTLVVTEPDGLKNKDYRVFLGTHIECALGACPTMWLYEPQIGNAYLSNCIVTGFEKEQNKEQLIFPNPAQDFISINNIEGQVILTNQFGQQFSISGTSQISVSNLPKGLYIATFIVEGKTIREKIVIQ